MSFSNLRAEASASNDLNRIIMEKRVSTTAALTRSSIKMFLRNKQALFFTLFIPIVIMTIFGLIGFDTVPKIKVGIVAAAPQQSTTAFIEQLKNISAFTVTVGSESDEGAALKKGDRAVVLMLPDSLIPNPAELRGTEEQQQAIPILSNAGQKQQASTAISIFTQMFDTMNMALAQTPQLFDLQVEEVNARNLKYIDFLLPGVVAMAVMQMAVFSVAFVFADYKEKGILKRLLATPMKPIHFVTANVVTRLIVAVVQAAILIAVGVLLFHSQVVGSYWLGLLVSTLGGIMFLGLGFTISGIAKTVDAVPAIANIVIFPMLFLGGVFFPTDSMPDWLQRVVQYLPLSYFSNGLREVMTNGAGFSVIASDVYWMIAWSVALILLAVLTFRLEERRV